MIIIHELDSKEDSVTLRILGTESNNESYVTLPNTCPDFRLKLILMAIETTAKHEIEKIRLANIERYRK